MYAHAYTHMCTCGHDCINTYIHFNLRTKILDKCIKGGGEVGIPVYGISFGSC